MTLLTWKVTEVADVDAPASGSSCADRRTSSSSSASPTDLYIIAGEMLGTLLRAAASALAGLGHVEAKTRSGCQRECKLVYKETPLWFLNGSINKGWARGTDSESSNALENLCGLPFNEKKHRNLLGFE